MRFFILILLGFYCLQLQPQKDTTILSEDSEVFHSCEVEKAAEIDPKIWRKYLEDNFEPDSLAMDSIPAGIYKISVKMIIDSTGKVSVAGIVDDPGFSLGQRLKTVIENYPGKWIPEEENGRVYKIYRIQPVIFIVGEKDTCTTESLSGLML
jgi:hypothetical protein